MSSFFKDKTYCTKCRTSPCYISLSGVIECSNIDCIYYSENLYPIGLKSEEKQLSLFDDDKKFKDELIKDVEKILAEIEKGLI